MFNTILKSKVSATIVSGITLAGLPAVALAHHHGFHVDVVVPAPALVVPVPPCDATADRVWVAPVYRTVTRRVWVEPLTTTKVQRVEVPAQYGWRDVMVYDYFGRGHIRRQLVQISPAHCEDQAVQVVVTPGHFEEQTHQELVCEGHWELAVPAVVPAAVRLEIPLPF